MNLKYRDTADMQMDYSLRHKYETLRSLLDRATDSLRILSDLEADLNHSRAFGKDIKDSVRRLIEDSLLMSQELNLITNNRHKLLYNVIYRIKKETEKIFHEKQQVNFPFAVDLSSKEAGNSFFCGEKAAELAFLKSFFENNVSQGFVITARGYDAFIKESGFYNKIRLLSTKPQSIESYDLVKLRSEKIRRFIDSSKLPLEIEDKIFSFAAKIADGKNVKWAVRASASVDEIEDSSFGGHFLSCTDIETKDLADAYKKVVSGRFCESASMYRALGGFSEVKTPMAVLFMPMLDYEIKGNAVTKDMNNPHHDCVVVNYSSELNKKENSFEKSSFFVKKQASSDIELISIEPGCNADIKAIISSAAKMAWKVKEELGFDLELQWVSDKFGNINFIQSRKLGFTDINTSIGEIKTDADRIVSGGRTLFPGRAIGNVVVLKDENDIEKVRKGSVVVIEKPEDFLVSVLPVAAAVVILNAHPLDPVLGAVRELSIPCLYNIGENGKRLFDKNLISVDATKRKIYNGLKWPGIRERVLARIENRTKLKGKSSLYGHILDLNLKNPDFPTFKAKLCGSVQDVIWYIQEMAARAMFNFGDIQKKTGCANSLKLATDLPVNLYIIDFDFAHNELKKTILPENIKSSVFKALWTGISDSRLFWPKRWEKKMVDMPSEFSEIILGGSKGPRRVSDFNYAIISDDYLNFNARLSYHYVMVDAIAGLGSENNYINFRFRDGGGNFEQRKLCACFIEQVLCSWGFGVDRHGDIINGWYRFYTYEDTISRLEMIGKIIVCARELDAVLKNDMDVKLYTDYFLSEKFSIFS